MLEDETAEVRIGSRPETAVSIGRPRVDAWNTATLPIRISSGGIEAAGAIELGAWSGGLARLPEFFDDLAFNWRGWTGPKHWNDDEGCVSMSATHDGKGLVVLHVEVQSQAHQGPGEWTATAEVAIEPGSLDRLANDLRNLVSRDIPER